MASLLLTTFILQLIIYLISLDRNSYVYTFLWNLYLRLPSSTSKAAQDQNRLRQDYLKIKQEMNTTSSQDEFAKWAKLRRQHDKVVAELEGKTSAVNGTRDTFFKTMGSARWIFTTGLRLVMQFWYRKHSLYWIPQGCVPSYVERLLAFSSAPTGSISIQVWFAACAAITALVGEALGALYLLIMTTTQGDPGKEKPQRVSANPDQSEGVDGQGPTEEKKER
ncbi:MAG: hypothetical protein M4579_006974 [Chaenotheca gracillima]|nr:MAG: hypothetical protein M4579_006974 [Chaenotheca gracillima]